VVVVLGESDSLPGSPDTLPHPQRPPIGRDKQGQLFSLSVMFANLFLIKPGIPQPQLPPHHSVGSTSCSHFPRTQPK